MDFAVIGRQLGFRLAVAVSVSLTAALPSGAQTFDILHAFYEPPGAPDAPLIEADGTLYGVTSVGGQFARGALMRRDPDGTVTMLHHFSESDGAYPRGRLLRGSDGALYGMTTGDTGYGGPDWGTLFKWDGHFTTLHRFEWRNGANPNSLAQGSDGALYGTTSRGGWFGQGTLFKWTGSLTILHDFMTQTISNGGYPGGPMVVGADGAIYGTTSAGGASGHQGFGILYKWNGAFTILHRFTIAATPTGLTKGSDGALYGTTSWGGFHSSQGGTIFKWNGSMTFLHSFNYADAGRPNTPLIEGSDGALYGTTERSVFKWNGSLSIVEMFGAGVMPVTGVVQGIDGALYGTTMTGPTPDAPYAPAGPAVFFRLETDGSSFEPLITYADVEPNDLASIEYGNDGALYGTTRRGGAHGFGTFFRLTTDGTFTVLHAFEMATGAVPGPLTKGVDGTLYGSTNQGGPNGWGSRFKWNGALTFLDDSAGWEGVGVQGSDGAWYVAGGLGYGSLWRWDGAVTELYTFTWGDDGAYPLKLSTGRDGAVYGTTLYGGYFNRGTLFKWQGGTFTTLHSFESGTSEPWSEIVTEGSDGALYGTRGGALYKWDGSFSTLHVFNGADGLFPRSGVIEGTDGALYGTTNEGPSETFSGGWGTVFRWKDGNLTTLHQFDYETGGHPTELLVKGGSDGAVYGSTREGGPFRKGVIFRVTPPDETAPLVSLVDGPADGGSYYFGAVPPAPTCVASDAQSGLAGSCTVTGYDTSVGTHTVTAMAADKAGNHSSASSTYTVLPLTLSGLYQPIDMNGVWNVVKNGSTVPLKFEVFAGATELTDTSFIVQPLAAAQVACDGGVTDEVELLASGGTSLRYDDSDGRFIYNWQTPTRAGYCYVVTVQLADGSAVSANVRTK